MALFFYNSVMKSEEIR